MAEDPDTGTYMNILQLRLIQLTKLKLVRLTPTPFSYVPWVLQTATLVGGAARSITCLGINTFSLLRNWSEFITWNNTLAKDISLGYDVLAMGHDGLAIFILSVYTFALKLLQVNFGLFIVQTNKVHVNFHAIKVQFHYCYCIGVSSILGRGMHWIYS